MCSSVSRILKWKTMNQTKLDRFQLVRISYKPNQTRSDIFSVWTFGFVGFVRTTYTPKLNPSMVVPIEDLTLVAAERTSKENKKSVMFLCFCLILECLTCRISHHQWLFLFLFDFRMFNLSIFFVSSIIIFVLFII